MSAVELRWLALGAAALASTAFLSAAIHQPWPMHHVCCDFLIANSPNAADVDGDGAPDFIAVKGDDLSNGLPTGVRIIWHPGRAQARDPASSQDAGRVPGTENTQYLYAECHDVNGDGALDLVVGGRRHPMTKKYASLRPNLSGAPFLPRFASNSPSCPGTPQPRRRSKFLSLHAKETARHLHT